MPLELDWPTLASNLAQLLAAYALALPIGWDRETRTRGAGLRTFPLVATASCAFVLLAVGIAVDGSDALGRVLAGLITGIGFIGGGAILKHGGSVFGTATATSIWVTASVGAAVALARFEMAIALSALTFVTMRFASPVKEAARSGDRSSAAHGGGDDGAADVGI